MKARSRTISLVSRSEIVSGILSIPDAREPSPALIVCHGALDFKENFAEFCEYLAARGVATLALDMHGHGASGGRRYHVNMHEWVPDISAALDHLVALLEIVERRRSGFLWWDSRPGGSGPRPEDPVPHHAGHRTTPWASLTPASSPS